MDVKALVKNERPGKAELRYIALKANLAQTVGVRWTRKIVNLIRHFYSAPSLQITAYIVTILRQNNVNYSNHDLINEMVMLKTLEGPATCHSLAKEIAGEK